MLILLGLLINFPNVALTASHNTEVHPFLISGVVQNSNNANKIKDFSDYLSKHTGYPLQISFATNYSDLSRKMRDDPGAIGWTCGAPYVQDHETDQQQLIAVPVFNQKSSYYSIVLTTSQHTEKKLSDFKGAVLAYSDSRSNSGFLSPKYALFKQGIEMNTHFRLLLNAGSHEGIIHALLNGLADVAAVNEYVWLSYLGDFPDAKNKLREVERMGPYPLTPIVASKGVSKKIIEKMTATLINMNNDKKGHELLKHFHLDGFVEKDSSFYDPIRSMLNKVDIHKVN